MLLPRARCNPPHSVGKQACLLESMEGVQGMLEPRRNGDAELESYSPLCETPSMNPDGPKFKLTAVFEPAPEGGFTCHFEELPEIFSEGETVDAARTNLWDAFEQVMAYHREEARKNATPGAVREELQLAAS